MRKKDLCACSCLNKLLYACRKTEDRFQSVFDERRMRAVDEYVAMIENTSFAGSFTVDKVELGAVPM
jgi:hypothetical protein